ncbi:MAG: PASTA domain-containing protein [Clostridia bacterium]|nr:PASTA domain-containing protein [Clostridia bacterium]
MLGTVVSAKYRIDSIIGLGGMSIVYKARRLSDNRVVAIKIPNEEYRQKPEYLRRFESEARAVMSLSHRNIIELLDVGFHDDIPYIVLEFATGRTLKEIIDDNGPLSPNYAVKIINQVLSALNHAHENGIIHRDIKPQNIIITASGGAKLTDFGIAKMVTASTKTFAGKKVLGSVHYISPEQAKGEEVTPASDIYSTGIMLYEMLTGRLPFDSDAALSVALMHLNDEMTPACAINPKVSSALSDVVLKACSKDIGSRYATAEEMRADLVRALKEPNGRFARMKAQVHGKSTKRRFVSSRVWIIPVGVIAGFALIISMFFLGSLMANGTSVTSEDVVPQLVGKTYAEAQEYARLREYTVSVDGYEISDAYPEGYVIDQSPAAGSRNTVGGRISVIISSGTGMSSVPNLVGLTQSQAIGMLADEGLVPELKQVYSDLPAGQVIRQDPESGIELHPGDTVTLYISGSDNGSDALPDVTGQNISAAVMTLRNMGFTRIRVREHFDDTYDGDDFAVIAQSPEADTISYLDQIIELTVNRKFASMYSADIAFNLDIPTSNASIMVTVIRADFSELVIYEGTHATAGTQIPISFCGYVWSPGSYECVVYINGVEAKRGTFQFAYRSAQK